MIFSHLEVGKVMNTQEHKRETLNKTTNHTSTRIAHMRSTSIQEQSKESSKMIRFFPLLRDEVLMVVVFSKMEVLKSTSGSSPKRSRSPMEW